MFLWISAGAFVRSWNWKDFVIGLTESQLRTMDSVNNETVFPTHSVFPYNNITYVSDRKYNPLSEPICLNFQLFLRSLFSATQFHTFSDFPLSSLVQIIYCNWKQSVCMIQNWNNENNLTFLLDRKWRGNKYTGT